MDIPDQLQEVRIFFADDGFVAVLEEVPCPFVSLVEGNGVPGHQFPHNLAERSKPGAQEHVKMVRDQGPGVALGLGLFQDTGKATEEGFPILIILEDFSSFYPPCHYML